MKALRFAVRHPFVFVPPLFYLLTAAPTIGFGDTAILIDAIQRRIVESHVNNHPFTVLMGMLFNVLFPFQDIAYRGNLVSVFFGSLTVMGFYVVVYRELSSRFIATVATALLMVCHSMWWHSTLVENYAASSFFTVIAIHLWRELRRTGEEKYLYLLCGAGGFSVLNHVQMGFLCLGIAATGLMFAWPAGSRRWTILAKCAGSAIIGLAPWIGLVLRDAGKTGSLSLAIKGAFVGSFSDTLVPGGLGASLYDTAYVFWFQAPLLYALVGFLGMGLTLRQKPKDPTTVGMLVFFLINTGNFAFYATWDKFAFLLISFINLYFHAAIALDWLLRRVERIRPAVYAVYGWLALSLVVPPYLYANIAKWGRNPDSVWNYRYNNRYSENLYFQSEYIVNPNKRGYYEVQRFTELLFAKLPPDSSFLDDDSRTYYPLADYYQRFYNMRPDVSVILVNSWGIANWGLGSDAVANLMTRAYFLNKPFFVATTQSPTGQFIREAKRHAPVSFEKFELGEGRWIYRLITSNENKNAPPTVATGQGYPPGFAPLNIAAPAGFLDLSLQNLLFFAVGEPSIQDMTGFDGEWQGTDQIFFNSSKPGGYLELGIHAGADARVNAGLALTAAPDFGIVEVELGDGGTKKRIDLYSPTVKPLVEELPEFSVKPGLNRIVVRIVGKNAKSSGYKAGIDGLRYHRTK